MLAFSQQRTVEEWELLCPDIPLALAQTAQVLIYWPAGIEQEVVLEQE